MMDIKKIIASEVRIVITDPLRLEGLCYCREVIVQNGNYNRSPFLYQMDCQVLAWGLVDRSIQGVERAFMRMWFLRHGDYLDGIDFPPKVFPEHNERIVDVLSVKPRLATLPPFGPRKISADLLKARRARRDEAMEFFDAKRVVEGIPPRPKRSFFGRLFGKA